MNLFINFKQSFSRTVLLGLTISGLSLGAFGCSNSSNQNSFPQDAVETQETPSQILPPNGGDAPVNPNDTISADPAPAAPPSSGNNSTGNANPGTTFQNPVPKIKGNIGTNKLIGQLPQNKINGPVTLEELNDIFQSVKGSHSNFIDAVTRISTLAHEKLEEGLISQDPDALQQFLTTLDHLNVKLQELRTAIRYEGTAHAKILEETEEYNSRQDSFVGEVQTKLSQMLAGTPSLTITLVGDIGTRLITTYRTSTFTYENEDGTQGHISFFNFSKDLYESVDVFNLSFLSNFEKGL